MAQRQLSASARLGQPCLLAAGAAGGGELSTYGATAARTPAQAGLFLPFPALRAPSQGDLRPAPSCLPPFSVSSGTLCSPPVDRLVLTLTWSALASVIQARSTGTVTLTYKHLYPLLITYIYSPDIIYIYIQIIAFIYIYIYIIVGLGDSSLDF